MKHWQTSQDSIADSTLKLKGKVAYVACEETWSLHENHDPGIPTTTKTMGVNTTTIAYLRVSIIEIGSTIILMVVEAQG